MPQLSKRGVVADSGGLQRRKGSLSGHLQQQCGCEGFRDSRHWESALDEPLQEQDGLRRRRKLVAYGISLLGSVAAVMVGALVGGRAYVLASGLVVLFAMLPFFVDFECHRPQAREVAVLAVLAALAVVARVAFAWVPHFKPMSAIIMMAGVGFGGSFGFLVGSLSILASNLIFGQGPWTPWQMLAFGLCGFVFGALADRGVLPRRSLSWKQGVAFAVAGGLFMVVVAGPILDTSSLFFMLSSITPEGAVAVYLAGFPVNCIQGASAFLTLLLAAHPILDQLSRIRMKYGLLACVP